MWKLFSVQVPFVPSPVGIFYLYLVLQPSIFFSSFPVPAFFLQFAVLDFVGLPASFVLLRLRNVLDHQKHLQLWFESPHTQKSFLRFRQWKPHNQWYLSQIAFSSFQDCSLQARWCHECLSAEISFFQKSCRSVFVLKFRCHGHISIYLNDWSSGIF